MSRVVGTLLSVLLVIALVGCESDPVEEAQPEPEETTEEVAEEAADDDGEVVDEEEEGVALEGGQWVESELYDVKIRVPEDWEIARAEDAVSATDSDGSTTVILAGSESDQTLQNAVTQIRSDLEFKEVNFESNEITTINGFAATRGRGSAVLVQEGEIDEEIQFLGYALRVGAKNVTLMIFSEATMYEAKRDIIDGIAHTIPRL